MRFSAITLNCWHGLNPVGVLRFAAMEPPERKEQRMRLQERILRESGADFLFLQEVSPTRARAKELAKVLGYDQIHQGDQQGLKVAGFGIPANLDNGIALLARPQWRMHTRQIVKLSGPPGFVSDFLSVQAAEFRFAILASVECEGRRLLLVDLHLHHGVQMTEAFAAELGRWQDGGLLTAGEQAQIESVLAAAERRREDEMRILLAAVQAFATGHDGVILAGDLNSTDEGIAWRMLLDAGFVDCFAERRGRDPGFTWDPSLNVENQSYARKFALPVPSFGRDQVKSLHTRHDQRRRRIDFIFCSNSLRSSLHDALLFAAHPVDGLFASDHFGVAAEWEI